MSSFSCLLPASMSMICSSPPIRFSHQKIVYYSSPPNQCTRFLSPLTFLPARKSMTKLHFRQVHGKHQSPLLAPLRRVTVPSLQYSNRSAWSLAFWRPLRWRQPPEDDEAIRQKEEEAARLAILEKAFESRQPADLMLRCELLFISFVPSGYLSRFVS